MTIWTGVPAYLSGSEKDAVTKAPPTLTTSCAIPPRAGAAYAPGSNSGQIGVAGRAYWSGVRLLVQREVDLGDVLHTVWRQLG